MAFLSSLCSCGHRKVLITLIKNSRYALGGKWKWRPFEITKAKPNAYCFGLLTEIEVLIIHY